MADEKASKLLDPQRLESDQVVIGDIILVKQDVYCTSSPGTR